MTMLTKEELDIFIISRLKDPLLRLSADANEKKMDSLISLIRTLLNIIDFLNHKGIKSYALPEIMSGSTNRLSERIIRGGLVDKMIEEFCNDLEDRVGIMNANPFAMYHDPKNAFKNYCGKYSITKRLIYMLFDFCVQCNIPIKLRYESFSCKKYYFNDFFLACNNLLHELCEMYSLKYKRDIKEITTRDLIKEEYIAFKNGQTILKKLPDVFHAQQPSAWFIDQSEMKDTNCLPREVA